MRIGGGTCKAPGHGHMPQLTTCFIAAFIASRSHSSCSKRQHSTYASNVWLCAAAAEPVLDWASTSQPLRVARQQLSCAGGAGGTDGQQRPAADLGWGLRATEDIATDDLILRVPLTRAITSDPADPGNWSVCMASQLLEQVALGAEAPLAPWLASLPAHVPLPSLYWEAAELDDLQDGDTIEEALGMRDVFLAAYEAGQPEDGGEALAWALSLVHSRSFVEGGRHVWVPGIDFANHTLAPNAGIRCVHSPAACQGVAALEEVAPPASQPLDPSCFELFAGEDIRAGEEVRISYGPWPNDVFLLFFGFVPFEANPNDTVVLFRSREELVAFAAGRSGAGGAGDLATAAAEAAEAELERTQGGAAGFRRLVVSATGFDGRLLLAGTAALQLLPALVADGVGGGALRGLLTARCSELLAAFPTSLEEDRALLAAGPGPRLEAALRYRMGKKEVLHTALEELGARRMLSFKRGA